MSINVNHYILRFNWYLVDTFVVTVVILNSSFTIQNDVSVRYFWKVVTLWQVFDFNSFTIVTTSFRLRTNHITVRINKLNDVILVVYVVVNSDVLLIISKATGNRLRFWSVTLTHWQISSKVIIHLSCQNIIFERMLTIVGTTFKDKVNSHSFIFSSVSKLDVLAVHLRLNIVPNTCNRFITTFTLWTVITRNYR